MSDPLALGAHIIESQHGIRKHFYDLLDLCVTFLFKLGQTCSITVLRKPLKAVSSVRKSQS